MSRPAPASVLTPPTLTSHSFWHPLDAKLQTRTASVRSTVGLCVRRSTRPFTHSISVQVSCNPCFYCDLELICLWYEPGVEKVCNLATRLAEKLWKAKGERGGKRMTKKEEKKKRMRRGLSKEAVFVHLNCKAFLSCLKSPVVTQKSHIEKTIQCRNVGKWDIECSLI